MLLISFIYNSYLFGRLFCDERTLQGFPVSGIIFDFIFFFTWKTPYHIYLYIHSIPNAECYLKYFCLSRKSPVHILIQLGLPKFANPDEVRHKIKWAAALCLSFSEQRVAHWAKGPETEDSVSNRLFLSCILGFLGKYYLRQDSVPVCIPREGKIGC